MTPAQISLVRRSFGLVVPIAPQAADLFYENLFNAQPELRRLFQGNMSQQGSRLMSMIATAVQLLDQPTVLLPVLGKLGARHVNYGVTDQHYDMVGVALLKTLEQGLGEAFTAEVREAWATMYGLVSRTMIEASRGSLAARAAA